MDEGNALELMHRLAQLTDKNILSGSQERSVHNLTVQRAKIIRLELKKAVRCHLGDTQFTD